MDTSIHSFSTHALFKQPIVITHLVSMVIAFLGCYPLLLTRQLRKRKVAIISLSCTFCTIGFITGYFIQTKQDTASLVLHIFGFILLCLVITQCIFHFLIKPTKWVDLILGWAALVVAFCYLVVSAVVFTDSCQNDMGSQCFMPLAMGVGFLMYGSFTLLHLLAIIKLPRPATPEYYESVIITSWGLISLILSDTNILGTEWKAINLGLLWFTGGLFSISLSVQAWIPAVRERNIVNSLIICLTGRGLKQIEKDAYIAKVHTMLGYILIVGSMTRLIQIIFRKSPTENLPRSMLRDHHLIQDEEVLDIEDDDLNLDNSKQKRCKHRSIFASITLVSGLLASILSISAGILFMGANTGWLGYMQYYIKDPSLYINITLAFAFLWLSYIFGLCTIYRRLKSKNAILEQYEYLELNSAQTERMQEQQPMTIATHTPILSSPPVFSPIDVIAQRSPIVEQEHATQHEKTMRPSEYRAKRRSLLVQSPTYETIVTSIRPKSSVTFGVGGVLPDEVIVHDNRRSWISSSGSSYSSGSNSPSFEHRIRRDSLNELMDEEGRRSVHKTNSGKRKERRLKQ
ncbi:hypothetical protein RMCBS344292_09998 [Rhizopus microsporus]|nr:hypothetical protein RMCBS344292_09998 [Rhizopus microsporus]